MPSNFGQVCLIYPRLPGFLLILFLIIELEDILRIPPDASLTKLDATLARFVTFCANYHGKKLRNYICIRLCSYPQYRAVFTNTRTTRARMLYFVTQ